MSPTALAAIGPVGTAPDRVAELQQLLLPRGATVASTAAPRPTGGSEAGSARTLFATELGQALDGGTATSTGAAGTIVIDDVPTATTATVTGDDVVATARGYLGVPYVWGGTTPAGLDCSGLVQLTYSHLDVSLPRVSRDQARVGEEIASIDDALPGDLVAFGSPVNHIAIYAGNGTIIEAPQPGGVVQEVQMYRTPVAIRRVVPGGDGSPGTSALAATSAPHGNDDGPDATDPLADTAPDAAGTARSTVDFPPGFPHLWASGDLARVPRAIPLVALGMTPARTGGDGVTAVDGVGAPEASAASTEAAAAASLPSGIGAEVARFADLFHAAETEYGLPATLLAAVAQVESGGNTAAVSPAGAQGLMQLMPGTAAGLGVTDPFDPAQAIDGAARLLAGHLDRFDGSIPLSLAAYNAGAGAVAQYGGIPPYAETQRYVPAVMALMEETV